ncbi:MAG: ATP-binding protein [Hyphomicrobiaceae bacterium]
MSRLARTPAAGRPEPPTDAAVLLALIPHALVVVAPDRATEGGRIVLVNPAAEDFFDQGAGGMIGRPLADLLVPASALSGLADKAIERGVAISEYGVAVALPRPGGQRIADVTMTPLERGPGPVLITIAERSRAGVMERQLGNRGAARTVAGLAQVLAHEIRNPLSGIRGAAQLIEATVGEEERQLTRLICTETDRIAALVARMEAFGDGGPIPMMPVNIHSVLDEVRRLALAGFARGMLVQEAYDPSLPPLPGNRDRLLQAILNLVKNAAEAIGPSRADGRIVLRTAYRPGLRMVLPGTRAHVALPLAVSVEDNGRGIPADLATRIFDPFVTTKAGGTGLGLALVAKVVEEHGGLVELDQSGGRTVFRLALPLAASDGEGVGTAGADSARRAR